MSDAPTTRLLHAILRRVVTLDFETEAIQNRPDYPPEPVGVAIRWATGDSEYLAWGHPSGNNCDYEDARNDLAAILHGNAPLLFHNAKFDLAVLTERMGFDMPSWSRVHDTQFLAFLADPHARSLELKPMAEELLDWPPDEKDEVAEWVWDNRKALVAEYGGKVTKAKHGPNSAGAWLSKCPAEIVEPYAIGDVDRTYALFEMLLPIIHEEGMATSYARKRQLLPILMENERTGIKVDVDVLRGDLREYERSMEIIEDHIREVLDVPGLNLDADRQLADALSDAGMVDDDQWVLTPSGQKSVSKDNLRYEMFNDLDFACALGYRNKLKTVLNTFLRPWLAQAERCGGVITTNWNQVRSPDGGTRTGRLSASNQNLMNIPKRFKSETDEDGFFKYDYPEDNELGVKPLPNVRKYLLPDPGHVWLHRDFSGQELRVFAHFENGPLMRAYQENPDLDPHQWVTDAIKDIVSQAIDRGQTKILNFQAIYGGGAPAAAKSLNCSLAEAKEYKAFHDKALPGRKVLSEEILRIVRKGEPIVTWGGRKYFPEEPKVINGQRRTFEYKLINYLIQGSASDITEAAIINWWEHPMRSKDARLLVTVYDEINLSAPVEIYEQQMAVLKECMEFSGWRKADMKGFGVAMRSDGKIGWSWGNLEDEHAFDEVPV